MEYKLTIGTFLIGAIITIISGLLVGFHDKVANNLGSGVSDYQNYKKWGLIGIGVGILVMFNIHTLILSSLVKLIFNV